MEVLPALFERPVHAERGFLRKRSSSPSLSETADGSSYGDSRLVTSLARGMGILRVFGDGTNALGNQDIATRTGLPKPTVSRLTYTLTALGYLSYSQETGRYQLGTGVLSLGYACLAGMGIQKMSRSLMQGLAEYSGVSVALGGRDHLDMIYLECRKGNSAVHLALDTGSRIDLATSALGRAYFVGVSETEQESLKRDIAEKNPGTWKTIHAGLEKARLQAIWLHDFTWRLDQRGSWRRCAVLSQYQRGYLGAQLRRAILPVEAGKTHQRSRSQADQIGPRHQRGGKSVLITRFPYKPHRTSSLF